MRRARLFAGSMGTLLASMLVVSTAWAYFTATGAGMASASVGGLSAPTSSSATPGAGTVALTWSAVSPPTGSDTVRYWVSRDGSSPGGSCATSASPTTATSCTDSGLAAGSHSYAVTAVWHTWTATSGVTNVTLASGAATKVAFTTQPSGGGSGNAWAQQPLITVQDAAGNTVSSSTASIALAIASQPGSGATLSCTTNPLAATAGVATFAGCKITGTAGSYTLNATSSGLTSATSSSVTITFGSDRQIVLSGSTANLTSGGTRVLTATIQDSSGNTVTSGPDASASVTFSQSGGAGSVTGLGSASASGGVAMITATGSSAGSVTISSSATLSGTPTTSNALSFSVVAGAVAKLAFTSQPGGGGSGTTWSTQPVVTVQDAAGNTVTGSSASISLVIASQPGSGATLSCTSNPLGATSGVATFAGCKISGTAGSYTLSATSSGLTSATSSSFTITFGAAAKLSFTTQPSGGGSGLTWAQQPTVTVQDSAGNTVTSSSASVSLAIASQPGSGAALTCTSNPQTASAGVATFAGCRIAGAPGSYTLSATASGLTSATSSSLTISNSVHVSSLVTGSTSGTTTWTGSVTMTVRDASGTAVSGVAVTGAWNPTSAATPSGCTTNASGQCTITAGSGAFPSTQLSESWTVFGLGASGYSYDSASNSATSITLSRGCSAGAVCATDLGDAYSTTPNSGSASVTLSGVNGTAPSNSTVLVLIARDGDQSTDAISSIDGTAITGAASVNSVGSMSSNANAFTRAWMYRATGAGTASGTVTVTFNNADNIATLVEVLVLSGENARTPVVQSVTNTGTSSTAAALLTSPSSSNAEIALVAEGKDTATQMSTPTGWTQFTWQHKPGANGTNVATYSGPSAAASQNITLGTSAAWGTIALEIARAT